MTYRREIDGLRALAVIPVILFHAGFETFKGGFVGVDVFFVISGYLITSLILTDLELGNFSIVNFLEGRARRILPALFLVLLISIPFAWLVLMPSEMKYFSQALIAVTIFASNILFWKGSSYFAAATELNPLLHTWSLALEQQYYILFPLFLMLFWNFGKRFILVSLGLLFLISLALSQWACHVKPAAAFYLIPTRGWELLIGVFAAFFLARNERKEFSKIASEVGGWLGVALILYAVFYYNKNTPFPGLYALVPTLGTLLIILFATQNTTAGKFFGNKFFVGIGLISYSAYLWHQPMFAFARHFGYFNFKLHIFPVFAVSLLLLSYTSWRYVEIPFRNKTITSKRKLFIFLILGSIFFLVLGLYVYKKNGNLGQITAEQESFLSYFENEIPTQKYFIREKISEKFRSDCDFYDIHSLLSGNETKVPVKGISQSCFTKVNEYSKIVFIWGDSHASPLYYGLNKLLQKDFEVLQVASSGCIASTTANQSNTDYCEQSNWFAFDVIKKIKPKIVIVGQNLGHNLNTMEKISSVLKKTGVERVIFTGPSPHWVPNLPAVVVRTLPKVAARTYVGIDYDVLRLDQKLKSGSINFKDFEYISLVDFFCNGDGCLVHYGSDVAATLTSWDYGHLTPIASFHLAKELLVPVVMRN
jgi:peptidoglycan/LPS O-acetylase OafA/YrhL